MLDSIKAVAAVVVIIGIWLAIPILAIIIATGLALVFFYHMIKEFKAEKRNAKSSQ